MWVCTICTKKIRWSGGGRRGRARELRDNDNDELDRQSQQAKAEAIMKLAVEALADPSPSTGHCTDNYGLHNSTIFIKRIMLIFYRYCWVIRYNFPVSPRIQMERSLLILILIMRHRSPMRLLVLVITNVEELTVTGILHRYYNVAQYLTRMEKQCASPLNKSHNHSNRSTPGTHSVSLITMIILPSQVPPFNNEHGK